ncbi:MAG: zinc-ribbon domain-containing protein [Candidatus Eisenbacteria bacterium]
MIVQCTGCRTKYKISVERLPASGVKVRCPKCRVIFDVKRQVEEDAETLGEKLFGKEVVRSAFGADRVAGDGGRGLEGTEAGREEVPPPAQAAEAEDASAESPAAEPEPGGEPESAASLPPDEQPTPPQARIPEEDPEILARALVSDILSYNREARDRGLAEGKILAYLGKEIARSWDIYKERVGLGKALSSDHFRDAVNDILGEGRQIL